MIIRNDAGRRTRGRAGLWVLLGAGLLLIGLCVLYWWANRPSTPPTPDLFCNMDTLDPEGAHFFQEGIRFNQGLTQSNTHAFSGEFSSRVNVESQYGVGIEFDDLRGGEVIEASVWIHSPTGVGSLIADGDWGFYLKGLPTGAKEGDWMQHSVSVPVPMLLDGRAKLKFFAYNPEKADAFFDDFAVRRIYDEPKPIAEMFPEDSIPTVNLLLGEIQKNKLEAVRMRALEKGVLEVTADDWVKTKLETDGIQIPAQLRLKGDWTDHLLGNRWSYRVKCKAPNAWNRMIEFSYQNPQSRDNLNEWVFHQWLRKEDVLTTRYDFMHLYLNGQSLGIYAYEEHFEKQVPEYNGRREGPILKFSEEGFWQTQVRKKQEDDAADSSVPFLGPSQIEAFKMGKTLGDTTLTKEFEVAQNLLQGFKNGEIPVDGIFDVNKMAQFFAIADLHKAWHGLVWHNLRFYYNPVTAKLEPIGFDGYTEYGPYVWFPKPFSGYARNPDFVSDGEIGKMYDRLFLNTEFMAAYIQYLYRYTDPEYVDDFLVMMAPSLNKRERILQAQYPEYTYDRTFLHTHARHLRSLMIPMEELSLKAYYEGTSDGKHQYKVFNYHCLPIELIGFGRKRSKMDDRLEEPVFLPAYADKPPAAFEDLFHEKKAGRLFFRVPGLDSVFSAQVLPWKHPTTYSPEQDLFGDLEIETNDLYEVIGDSVVQFHSGEYETRDNILIPPGYTVRFDAGVKINMLGKAKFISKSPVMLLGNEESPIEFYSEDKSANGFTVLQADGRSVLKHVIFREFNTLNYNNWTLTGAVTFYESDVNIDHVNILNNHCEDALNLVRSRFTIKNAHISTTAFDGFDADFCTGYIENSRFTKTGNDAMDFSGSEIGVRNCIIEASGDKGISAGEQARIHVYSTTINGAVIGIASKDLSVVKVDEVNLQKAQTGFAAYKKKPEYGPATIYVKKAEIGDVKRLHFIEYRSLLKLEGKEIKGEI